MPTVRQHIEALETYKDLFDNAHDLIHFLEPDGRIIYVNNAWKKNLGYSEEEIEGTSIYRLVQKDDRDRFIDYRKDIIQGLHRDPEIILGMVHKNGNVVHLQGFVSTKFVNGKSLYTRGIFRDVTTRLRNETRLKLLYGQLQERESNLQKLLAHAPDSVVVVDSQSRILYWNPKAEAVFGWSAAEVTGKSLTQLIIPPQYRKAHEEGMTRYVVTGEQRVLNRTVEITALNRENKEFYVALTISSTVQNGQSAFIAFIRDINEQKKNEQELEHKRYELELSNQELEQFAHVASHDMKEPIRKMLVLTEQLQMDSSNIFSEKSKNYIDRIRKSATRLAQLVDGVLAHSSLGGEEAGIQKVSLDELMAKIESDLELPLQQKKAVLKYSNLPVIHGAPFLIYQLFYNLINNSLKFTRSGVKPVIEIETRRISLSDANEYGLMNNSPYYEIVVKDNGIGFRSEHAQSIFRRFVRLNSRDNFEGTGLGLAVCKTIVEKHEGAIVAYGEENVGATFKIILPVHPHLE